MDCAIATTWEPRVVGTKRLREDLRTVVDAAGDVDERITAGTSPTRHA
ncbi:hypothetical protein [Nocardia rhizosphaerihabitans]|nr:hypothetical protein [Nocardia rhizosphaerihabitans]